MSLSGRLPFSDKSQELCMVFRNSSIATEPQMFHRTPGAREWVEGRKRGHLHGAELGATHGAEVGGLGGLLGQRGIVEQTRSHRVQRQVELVIPAPTTPHYPPLQTSHAIHKTLGTSWPCYIIKHLAGRQQCQDFLMGRVCLMPSHDQF